MIIDETERFEVLGREMTLFPVLSASGAKRENRQRKKMKLHNKSL